MAKGTAVPKNTGSVHGTPPRKNSSPATKKGTAEHSLILSHLKDAKTYTPTVLFDSINSLFDNVTNAFQLGNGSVIVAFDSEPARNNAILRFEDIADTPEQAAKRKQPLTAIFGDKVVIKSLTKNIHKFAIVGVPRSISLADACQRIRLPDHPIPPILTAGERGSGSHRTIVLGFDDEKFVESVIEKGEILLMYALHSVERPHKPLPAQCYRCQQFGQC